MNFILKRLKEPSTWAGLSVFAALFGVPEDQCNAVAAVGAAVAGAVAVFLPESGR